MSNTLQRTDVLDIFGISFSSDHTLIFSPRREPRQRQPRVSDCDLPTKSDSMIVCSMCQLPTASRFVRPLDPTSRIRAVVPFLWIIVFGVVLASEPDFASGTSLPHPGASFLCFNDHAIHGVLSAGGAVRGADQKKPLHFLSLGH